MNNETIQSVFNINDNKVIVPVLCGREYLYENAYDNIEYILTIYYCNSMIVSTKEMIGMANISNAINMSFRVDKDVKAQADELFKNLGMNKSVALNMFLTQCVRQQALPFVPSMISPEPSEDLKEALQEVKDIESEKIKVQGYHNINTFIDDMLK